MSGSLFSLSMYRVTKKKPRTEEKSWYQKKKALGLTNPLPCPEALNIFPFFSFSPYSEALVLR